MSYGHTHFNMQHPFLNPRNKKKGWILSSLLVSIRGINYFTSKLALLDSCLASAEDLSTEVSSPYPL